MDKEIKKYLQWLLPTITITIALWGIYLLITYIFPFVKTTGLMLVGAASPFIIALLVAVLIDPLVNYLENKVKLPRSIAVVLSLLIVLGLISLLLILVSSRLIIELMHLSGVLPDIYNFLSEEGWQLIKDIRTFISSNPLPPEVQQSVQDNLAEILNTIKQFLGRITEVLIGFLATLPLIFTILIVAAVATLL